MSGPHETDDWVDCWNCGGEGEIEDEDWRFQGHFYQCDICDGKGGWKRHDPEIDADELRDAQDSGDADRFGNFVPYPRYP